MRLMEMHFHLMCFYPDPNIFDGGGQGNACDAGLNGDSAVNFLDLGILKSFLFIALGPSTAELCTP